MSAAFEFTDLADFEVLFKSEQEAKYRNGTLRVAADGASVVEQGLTGLFNKVSAIRGKEFEKRLRKVAAGVAGESARFICL